ncbi:hydantoinase/oxoprolinase family protein [Aneurinibacillus danicus]|uniref:Acetone carboxylase subunit beta n=1 Tax=Aneurinibacillus danicus TaxID=267746 RepID=A0A511V8T5_9BACL|nr:hydantoinase/oxoprolinase family protein [Aneurinibacillus danicus]GEN35354.1 acetone carboxylase subunit beta [Aneurinibacillus danicus]
MARIPQILAIDAGGTMTDTFLIDANGEFVVGKSQTTPEDESVGFTNSVYDALSYWGISSDEAFSSLVSGIYSGTAMLNRLLERKGRRIGLIVTKGQEDYLRMERGLQTYLGYSYSDRLHLATHTHNTPLVPRERIRGVTERSDLFGDVIIPLYEDDVRQAVKELIAEEIEYLCVNLLYSYKNPSHEQRVKEIALEVFKEEGVSIPLFLSSELYPLRRDFPRLNTLLIEAYAAEPSRDQLKKVNDASKKLGANFEMRVMASHGGTIGIEAKQLARTLVSGPIGGVIGAKYLADQLGSSNVVCTDIGGTSFDLALITDGEYQIKSTPDIARFILNLPLVQIDSVGAGTGTYIRVNPSTKRIELGPDSAGYRIGVCYEEGDVDTPTISDCNLILGYLNPDNFLGGEVKLNKERAYKAFKEQVADVIGMDVYEAAQGVISLFEDSLRNQVIAMVLGKGYTPVNYTMLSYGGGGPLHTAGYTEGLGFQDVLVPAWAAGFSAFGCSCADFEYRYDKTVDLPIAGAMGVDPLITAAALNEAWKELREKVKAEFEKSKVDESRIQYKHYVRMQYQGQLNDLEIRSETGQIENLKQLEKIVMNFEEMYGKVYARSAKSPELGYLITTAVVTGVVEVEKPKLPIEPLSEEQPPAEAYKGQRDVYYRGKWIKADIWEMEAMKAGNRVKGMSIIESPSSTFVVPLGRTAYLDVHRIFHLQNETQK